MPNGSKLKKRTGTHIEVAMGTTKRFSTIAQSGNDATNKKNEPFNDSFFFVTHPTQQRLTASAANADSTKAEIHPNSNDKEPRLVFDLEAVTEFSKIYRYSIKWLLEK